MDNQRRNSCSARWIYCPLSSSFLCLLLSHGWPEYSFLNSLGFDAKLMICNSFHLFFFPHFLLPIVIWPFVVFTRSLPLLRFGKASTNNNSIIFIAIKNVFNSLIFTKQILSDTKGIQMPVLLALLLTAMKKKQYSPCRGQCPPNKGPDRCRLQELSDIRVKREP